jgi:xanthine dehydrogenase small subunit
MSTRPIRFLFRDEVREVADVPPTRTVLQHLREDLHCTGTKEGCAEGDCGACTVVLASRHDGEVVLEPVNACIQLLPALDGKALFTVEDVEQADGTLHPVQRALVECHGSQCGFCTPGFVMSLWSLYEALDGRGATRAQAEQALSGNLCRCTGYRPIIDAAARMGDFERCTLDRDALLLALASLDQGQALAYEAPLSNASTASPLAAAGAPDSAVRPRFDAPASLADLLALRAARPQALLVAGGTDVGLWVTKQLRELPDLISTMRVPELQEIRLAGQVLEIGAAARLEWAYEAIVGFYPELKEMWQRFASLPIRTAATLGGNVANGSPIGDSMPWLIALGAEVELASVRGRRRLPLEDFYLGYQKKDLAADEVVLAIRLPLAWLQGEASGQLHFRAWKLSKRFDQDISAVCAGMAVRVRDGRIVDARLAFGGMAATPKRAARAEAALAGQPLCAAAFEDAQAALAEDFAPLTDMRASSAYRMEAARSLIQRFWLEIEAGAPVTIAALLAGEGA